MQTDNRFSKASRPDEKFLDQRIYPIAIPVHIRFQDLDPLGHVNNVAMAGLFEDVRVRIADKLDLQRFKTGAKRTLIINVELSYLNETFRKSELVFHAGIGHIGNSSWRLHVLAIQNGKNVFAGNATFVYCDENGTAPLPQKLIETIKTLRLQV